MKTLYSLGDAIDLINLGKNLVIAGDENLLRKLPEGNWIGGSIPYFMTDAGGISTSEFLFINELPDFITIKSINFYQESDVDNIPKDYPENGFSYILIPAGTKTHYKFAKECSTWNHFFESPILGWITGVKLEDIGIIKPKVFNGKILRESDSEALVMHINLPENLFGKIGIINLFSENPSVEIEFFDSGFQIENCLINGKIENFSNYINEKNVSIELPLIANYNGALINVSFQKNDLEKNIVNLYAPVFKGIKYRFANSLNNYQQQFRVEIDNHKVEPVISFNCILNYVYGGLEGKKIGNINGPMTFGEIAYILLNQTLVYLTIEKKADENEKKNFNSRG